LASSPPLSSLDFLVEESERHPSSHILPSLDDEDSFKGKLPFDRQTIDSQNRLTSAIEKGEEGNKLKTSFEFSGNPTEITHHFTSQ